MHLRRQNPDDDGQIDVVSSALFVKFGEKYLSSPGPKSGIKERRFYDLKKETIQDRISVKPNFKTLDGIKSVFQYICKTSGEVLWRKLPCFCVVCSDMRWEDCPNVDIVEKLKVVVKAGVEF